MTRLAYVGDDVTGSIDVLVQARRAGMSGVLVMDAARLGDDLRAHDVVGVATVTRSLPTSQIPSVLDAALDGLARLDPDVVQYKVCSTADSSPMRGSIGRALEVLRERFAPACIPVCFAQPDFGRWTVFGHHFAAEGGRVYRLDRQPTMSQHPATPMTESDLTVHLSRQTELPIGLLPWTAYGDARALAAAMVGPVVVADALTEDHLDGLSRQVLASGGRPAVVVASGGLTLALARAMGPGQVARVDSGRVPGGEGPVLAVSGSCSARTAAQVDAAVAAGWVRVVLADGEPGDDAAAALRTGDSVVVTSVGTPRTERDVVDGLAHVVEAAGDHAARVILCGGDTSGHILRRLGAQRLEIVACPWGNLPLLRVLGGVLDGAQLVCKGGQMGEETLFEDVRML